MNSDMSGGTSENSGTVNAGRNLWNFYHKHYKPLLIIPFVMLFAAIGYLIFLGATTGEIIPRDVSLKGGVIITIPLDKEISAFGLQQKLLERYPSHDISVRELRNLGKLNGIIIEADISTNKEDVDGFLDAIQKILEIDLENTNYGIETIGSTLGANFFSQSLVALLIAFVCMGLAVFIYFRTFVPSIAVILAAASDMIVTLAVLNIFGIKIGTAGIAAFLMLIGYSVDTDVLLTIRTLKRKEGTVFERIESSVKTGMTMTITAIVVCVIALIATDSEVIRQIMVILIIGLVADIINTWIQNVGILRLYLARKEKKAQGSIR